jgi:mannose-1-phosphate guanylyltransferase
MALICCSGVDFTNRFPDHRRMPVARAPRSRRLPRYVVILAGGEGKRFWPRSRRRAPKQLLAIEGRRTLLQETVRRLLPLCSWERVVVVTNAQHAAAVRHQLPRVRADQILVEPVGRNTAACIALGAEWIAARAGDAIMIAVPADHVIKDARGLRRTLAHACVVATDADALVTVGIAPVRPETGYGYIELGKRIAGQGGACWVRRFHEKPSLPKARAYLAGGRHMWNSGMFVFKAGVVRRALQQCVPELYGALEGVWATPRGVARRLQRAYRTIPSVSFDIAVMQPAAAMHGAGPPVAVVRGDFDWSDVGSWVAMPEIWGCDERGNAALGRMVPIDSSDSIVYCPERLVALVGVKDLIVVDSEDALLICSRQRAQDVQRVTHELKERGWSQYL